MKKPLFLDVDGILVDWCKGAHEIHDVPYFGDGDRWPYARGPAGWNFCRELGIPVEDLFKGMGHEFWASLDWTADGKRILEYCENIVGPLNVFLLTSPCSNPGTIEGRMEWIRREMPEYAGRTIIATVDDGGNGCKRAIARLGTVLIDDYDCNVDEWTHYDGLGLLYPRPWNSNHTVTDPMTWLTLRLNEVYGDQ